MSLANQSLLNSLGITGFWVTDDDVFLPNLTTQAAAYPIKGEVSRFTAGSANSSVRMKSVLSGEASPLTFIVNDTPNAIVAFPEVGEFNNGVQNASLSIPAGQAAVFVRVPNNLSGGSSGWRSAVIP